MSIRAQLWAWDEAPVKDAVEKLILLALADEARDDGTAACPYKDKLIERALKSERTVQDKLRNLYRNRLIDFGDQIVGMRRYNKTAQYAPRTWNLNYAATKANPPEPRSDEEMQKYVIFMQSGRTDFDEDPGVQKLPPCSDQGEHETPGVQKLPPCETPPPGVQKLPPSADQAKQSGGQKPGVQPTAPFPLGSKTKRSKTSRFSLRYELKDQEKAIELTDPDNKSFFPQDLDDRERSLLDECLALAVGPLGLRWTANGLQKVIGTPLIRQLAAQDPELVRQAFVFAAADPETTSPRRLLWIDRCGHWEKAEAYLALNRTADVDDPGQAPEPVDEDPMPAPAGAAPAQRSGGQPPVRRSAAENPEVRRLRQHWASQEKTGVPL